MARVVYIQTGEDGHPYSVSGAVAARGFAVLGFEVRYFRPEELPHLPIGAETVVVGGMGTVRSALARINDRIASPPTVPAVLTPFLGREAWRTNAKEIVEAAHFPVFVKPYEDSKMFTGKVVKDAEELRRLLQPQDGFPNWDEELPLLAQEPVSFVSEWRVFVVRRIAIGVSHYRGDALIFPNGSVIRRAIGAFQGAPAGYCIDFGVTDDDRTLLIEVNDGYSLGHGGLVANLYAELLKARWDELTGS